MNNVFWNIYLNLEREVLNLADMVHFTDNQVSVYSVRISDLLIRCNVEVESLIRELYKINYKEISSKVGEMLVKLNNEWSLERKLVSIISTNMHYSAEYSSFCPFFYDKNDENDFYSAYNAIKHDRSSNFEKYATIHYLLRALGALYILNIYYRQEEFNNLTNNFKLDSSLGSRIFSFHTKVLNPKYPVKNQILSSDEELRAFYIIKPLKKHYYEYYNEFDRVFLKQKEVLRAAGFVPEKDEDGDPHEISYDEVYKIAVSLESVELIKKISELETPAIKKHQEILFKATINKHQKIYYLEDNEEEQSYE